MTSKSMNHNSPCRDENVLQRLSFVQYCTVHNSILHSFYASQTTFGDKLITKFMFDIDYTDEPYLPAPEQLKYKIIIKNKKILGDLPVGISSPR